MRVETPHEVCQTSSCLPSFDRYCVLKALAKLVPSSWLVPS